MARVALKDWKEQIRDPKIECMSRDEMTALQSDRLVKQVKNVYENVEFYRKKMDEIGVEPGDIKGIEDIGKLPFTTKEDLRAIIRLAFWLFQKIRLSGFREHREQLENLPLLLIHRKT